MTRAQQEEWLILGTADELAVSLQQCQSSLKLLQEPRCEPFPEWMWQIKVYLNNIVIFYLVMFFAGEINRTAVILAVV